MASALTVIQRALRLIGVTQTGQAPTASEANDALSALNLMLDNWSNEKLMIYTVVNNLFNVVAGQTDYTLGTSGSAADWISSQATRPLNVQRYAGFIRANQSGINTDYAMDYYPNDRFQNIFQKQISTNYPYAWTCDWQFPISTVRLYPNPTINTVFGLTEYAQLRHFTGLTDLAEFPPGYENAIGWNLALELSPEYGVEPSAIIIEKAKETKYNIKRSNQQPVLMTVDRSMLTHGIYSIYGDR